MVRHGKKGTGGGIELDVCACSTVLPEEADGVAEAFEICGGPTNVLMVPHEPMPLVGARKFVAVGVLDVVETVGDRHKVAVAIEIIRDIVEQTFDEIRRRDAGLQIAFLNHAVAHVLEDPHRAFDP